MADLYAEKASEERYTESKSQMKQTEDLLRSAAQAIADVWLKT
jgi:hypothetical protein